MGKKYEILKDTEKIFFGRKVYKIRALKDFADVKKGDIGGFVESEKNLSQDGDCWIYGNAIACDHSKVSEHAKVYGNAKVSDNAFIGSYARVCGNAVICDYAKVSGSAFICDYAKVRGYAEVSDNAEVYGNAKVSGNATISGNVEVSGNAIVCGSAIIRNHAIVRGYAKVYGNAVICDHAVVYGSTFIYDNAKVCECARVFGDTRINNCAKIKNQNQWFVIDNVGSRKDNITFYETDGVIYANVGCFNGTLDEFIRAVRTTHKGNEFEKEYLKIAELAKIKLGGLNEKKFIYSKTITK